MSKHIIEAVKFTFLCMNCGSNFDSVNRYPFCIYCGDTDVEMLGTEIIKHDTNLS